MFRLGPGLATRAGWNSFLTPLKLRTYGGDVAYKLIARPGQARRVGRGLRVIGVVQIMSAVVVSYGLVKDFLFFLCGRGLTGGVVTSSTIDRCLAVGEHAVAS